MAPQHPDVSVPEPVLSPAAAPNPPAAQAQRLYWQLALGLCPGAAGWGCSRGRPWGCCPRPRPCHAPAVSRGQALGRGVLRRGKLRHGGGGGGRSHGLDQGRGWGKRGSLAAGGPGAAPVRVPAAGGCCAARWCCPPPNRAAALQPPAGPCPEPAGLGAEVPRAHPGLTARSLAPAALEGPCRSRNLRPQKPGGPLEEYPHLGHVPPSGLRGLRA